MGVRFDEGSDRGNPRKFQRLIILGEKIIA